MTTHLGLIELDFAVTKKQSKPRSRKNKRSSAAKKNAESADSALATNKQQKAESPKKKSARKRTGSSKSSKGKTTTRRKRRPKAEPDVDFQDSVRYFLSEVGRIPLLTGEEEVRLANIVRHSRDE